MSNKNIAVKDKDGKEDVSKFMMHNPLFLNLILIPIIQPCIKIKCGSKTLNVAKLQSIRGNKRWKDSHLGNTIIQTI